MWAADNAAIEGDWPACVALLLHYLLKDHKAVLQTHTYSA